VGEARLLLRDWLVIFTTNFHRNSYMRASAAQLLKLPVRLLLPDSTHAWQMPGSTHAWHMLGSTHMLGVRTLACFERCIESVPVLHISLFRHQLCDP
jgi:hypothetical protein